MGFTRRLNALADADARSAAVAEAAALLAGGGLVAFPTETVYGLGVNARDAAAVGRLYEAKGRPARNPLIVHVAGIDEARSLARHWPDIAQLLAERFWPGPLTLVVESTPAIPDLVRAGGPTVALRVPDHPIALDLLNRAGIPLAAPSANRSGHLSPTTADHVLESLDGRINAVLDGGACTGGIESTVVDVSDSSVRILRPGLIDRVLLERVLGTPVLESAAGEPGGVLKSPGVLDRHYAPVRPAALFTRPQLTLPIPADVVAVAFDSAPDPGHGSTIVLPGSPAGAASGLYAALWRADALQPRMILIEAPPPGPEWEAIRDRLRRATTPEQPASRLDPHPAPDKRGS